MNTQKCYILLYQTGGPQSLFWDKNDLETHKDSRHRYVKNIYEIDASQVYVDPKSKKKYLYFLYQSDETAFKILAVTSNERQIREIVKLNGYTLGNGWYIGDLDTPNKRC